MTFGRSRTGTGTDNSIPEGWERERKGNGKNHSQNSGRGRERKKSIPTFRERESEAIIPGNTREWKKTPQELRMLSRSLSDCKPLILNVTIQVSQFVSNCQLCH